jgi:hypothetical protein
MDKKMVKKEKGKKGQLCAAEPSVLVQQQSPLLVGSPEY